MAKQIPFDEWHGKAFKIVKTPSGKALDRGSGRVLPDDPNRVSIVTPENGDAWNWPEAAPEHIQKMKLQWKQFNNSKVSRYKKNQILRSIKRIQEQ